MKYEELDFFEFFESEPTYLFEKEAGICSYSYEKENFKIRASLSCYEDYMIIDILYNVIIVRNTINIIFMIFTNIF